MYDPGSWSKESSSFNARTMSSISTLEFAWEHKSLWPSWWNEICFCWQVAETNKLELLKWIREEKKCEWDYRTINVAARQGNLEMVKYCVANECPINTWACTQAKARWDFRTADWAAENGHLHILEYLVERKYDRYNEDACANAAMNGHLDCLKYLHETAKWPWYEEAVREAHQNNHPECVQYLLDNDCPLPEGWSYANGELHKLLTMTSGEKGVAMTRLRKRKVGQRDSLLWDLIVDNDDICFKHILPRLNSNDVKFFYEVNGETRALVKRSTRKGELEKGFKVSEMSSILTLEVAWEHKSLWPSRWDETNFCWRVAYTNKLELLKWAIEEKNCKWDALTINAAAMQGNMEMVKYCVAKKCPGNEIACACAAENGHLECLKYLREEVKAPWGSETAYLAALNGHLHILEYLVERKFDEYTEDACENAAMNGQLDCLKYLHETAKAPWDSEAVRRAHESNQTECLQYLLDNNCPLPEGWSYEDGELHSLGPTKLWTGLVVHHKDVFVSHVISKLNRTDRFFFSKANKESRGVLEYAGVKVSGLGWGAYECSSVSTLELVWNHMPWGKKEKRGRVIDQAWFCEQVAATNKLEFLEWVREVKHCEWDEWTINQAAIKGNLEMLKYCFSNGCPCDKKEVCKQAAAGGHLDCLRFLFDKVKPSRETEEDAAHQAAGKGRINIVKYFVEERKISDDLKPYCVATAAMHGRLDCLNYLVEEAKTPLHHWLYIAYARYHEHPDCENYLLEKGSPEPTDEKSAAKDRGYVTATEWKLDGGGKKNASVNAPLKKLPFNCCALSFLPFETPVFDVNSGSIYDLENIFPYALKHKQDPITGRNMQIKDLKELKLKKSEGNKDFTYECPILGSEFTDSTKICVVKRSGYAYSYKAIEELVIKPKRWRDLMTDEKITRDDLLIMDHVITKKGANFIGSKGGVKKEGGSINADAMSEDVKRALDALKTKEAKEAFKGGGGGKVAEMEMKKANDARNNDDDEDVKVDLKKLHQYADKPHAADVVKFAPGAATFSSAEPVDYSKKGVSDRDYFLKRPLEEERQRFLNSMKRFLKPRRFEENHSRSDGKQAMGFTSTIGGEGLKGGKEKKPVFLNPKKGEKGYVSLDIQQFGSLNLELHCDIAPRTCENFLHLCEKGFYDGVKFHRNVPNFMIQGGDPTGTGKKGFSIYGETFKDEFGLQKGVLSHKERGIVSMANKGKDTNNSQFFITYGKNLTHLDGKHTIFGRVVGGLKVLDELEDIEADDKHPEKPGVDIIIEKTTVHQNPGSSSSPGIERSMNTPRERSGGRKRKRDARLWDVIVNNDDICFTHVLPRLNATDVKFLYEVNTETRKLIKRSSREGELKKKFKIEEMSSISTLELAWEHCPWGTLINYNQRMNETYFCREVAYTNKLELLKWIREEKKCTWNSRTINVAARQGNLEMVKYCVANECPIDAFACACAAENGRLECLKYLREEAKVPCDATTAYRAASNGHLHILEYLVERKYDQFDVDACRGAAMEGQLDCLKYLRETAKAPWDLMAPTRMCTIPPRQQLSYTRWLAIRRRKVTRARIRFRIRFRIRIRRLKLGPTKLWTGLVLHHKDVFVSHVISKLNRTDRRFFSKVNGESWDVLEYAGVNVSGLSASVYECSSISTLEWAWNNMPWGKKDRAGRVLDQAWFCREVAATNNSSFSSGREK
ncbi:unnamed protein product [Bathycoccus prasinos]